jgi:hypothetical protein
MKEFLKTRINWKAFIIEMLIIFAFFSLSYWAGKNEFPEKVWTVPVGTAIIGLAVLMHGYLDYKIRFKK